MVVVPEPAVKGGGAFDACAVDGAVGPAVEQCADESFGFSVGLGPVGAGSAVSEVERPAGKCVHGGAVGAAVVGEDALDADAVLAVEGGRASEERRGGRAFFV